jgi:signal peptidase
VLAWVRRVAAWTVILGVGAVLAVSVVVPRLGGGTPYAVLTGSMRPSMPPGTLVVVRPADPGELGIGDVITYQRSSGEPTVVTHRIVAIEIAPDGQRTFRTQGDANDAPDLRSVRPVQIRGKRWYSVPWLGFANRYVDGDERQVVTLVAAGALGVYALAMFAGAANDRRRPGRLRPAEGT